MLPHTSFKKLVPLAICICFGSYTVFSQEITKEMILQAFWKGDEVYEAIDEQNLVRLNKLIGSTADARWLVALRKDQEAAEEPLRTLKDIYYHPDIDAYIFTIHCAKWIETDSDWGLNDYRYVLEMRLDFDPVTQEVIISDHHLLQNKEYIKNWWRSLMTSYNDPKFLRHQWAEDFKLIPPPPPPPGNLEWMKQ